MVKFSSKKSRRTFIKNSAIGAGGFMIVPRHVLGGKGYVAPSDKINIATIGAGGKGRGDTLNAAGYDTLTMTAKEHVVALCDVDYKNAEATFNAFPQAKQYKDFREMLDRHSKEIDAVIVSTPDHTHAVATMAAMKMGKHVYVQKPLTHDVYEARVLTEAARKYGVVAQMGNQGSSGDDTRRICEWVWGGLIGEVKEVHCWTNRPVWEQSMHPPKGKKVVPEHFDWDLWLGTAPFREFNDGYHPFNWRGWWDFGTGALGDMACHIMDPVVRALKLKYPTAVQAFAPFKVVNWGRVDPDGSPPVASTVHYDFPARGDMPAVKLTWYDGGMMPPRPDELEDDEPMGNWDGGVIMVGSEGKIMFDCYGANARLLPLSRMTNFEELPQTLERVKEENHQRNWIAAIRGEATLSSDFDFAGPFSEIILMGNLAIRSLYIQEEQFNDKGEMYMGYTGVGKKLKWDGENMRITNYEPANRFVRREYREGWML